MKSDVHIIGRSYSELFGLSDYSNINKRGQHRPSVSRQLLKERFHKRLRSFMRSQIQHELNLLGTLNE